MPYDLYHRVTPGDNRSDLQLMARFSGNTALVRRPISNTHLKSANVFNS